MALGLQELLAPAPDDLIDAVAVSKIVNSPKNDGPERIEGICPVNERLAPSARLLGLGLLQRLQRQQLDFARRFPAVFEVAAGAAGNG